MRVRSDDDPEDDPIEDEDKSELYGPDQTDRDLIDGTWEDEYYAGQRDRRDWSSVQIGLAILVVLALVVPSILVFTR